MFSMVNVASHRIHSYIPNFCTKCMTFVASGVDAIGVSNRILELQYCPVPVQCAVCRNMTVVPHGLVEIIQGIIAFVGSAGRSGSEIDALMKAMFEAREQNMDAAEISARLQSEVLWYKPHWDAIIAGGADVKEMIIVHIVFYITSAMAIKGQPPATAHAPTVAVAINAKQILMNAPLVPPRGHPGGGSMLPGKRLPVRSAKDPFAKASDELETAREALDRMRYASSFEEYQRGWQSLLAALGKCWNKIQSAGSQITDSKYQPWFGKIKHTRNKDPLLKYIGHARDADTHSIQDLLKKEPGYTTINPAFGNKLSIRNLQMENGQVTRLESNVPIKVDHYGEGVRMVKCMNHSAWMEPPTEHQGHTLPDKTPITAGLFAIGYYENFIQQAQAKFGSSHS